MSFYKNKKICPFSFYSFYVNKEASQAGGCHHCVEKKCQLWMETEDEEGNVQGECAVVNIAEALMYSADNSAISSGILQMLLKQQQPKVETPKVPKQKPGVAELMRDLDELDEPVQTEIQTENDDDLDDEDGASTPAYSLTDVFSKLRDKPPTPPPASNIPPMPPPIVPVIIPNAQQNPQTNGETSEPK